jgi:hypothetical protein
MKHVAFDGYRGPGRQRARYLLLRLLHAEHPLITQTACFRSARAFFTAANTAGGRPSEKRDFYMPNKSSPRQTAGNCRRSSKLAWFYCCETTRVTA